MPNQMSPDSRRANFIVDKEFYAGLEKEAGKQRISVGELIRRALEQQFPHILPSHSIIQITPTNLAKRHVPMPKGRATKK